MIDCGPLLDDESARFMNVELAYGCGKIAIPIPDSATVDTFALSETGPEMTFADFRDCMAKADADTFFTAHRHPLFLVNDGYRHTPTAKVLEWLHTIYPDLIERSTYGIATGAHEAPSVQHLRSIFGELLPRVADNIWHHDANDMSSMVEIGIDSFSQPVFLNKHFFQAKHVVVIGSVEPHYFAGFTGGRKALVPGIADIKTTERNHNMASSLDCQPMRLHGNPVAEHLQAVTDLIRTDNILSVQLVANSVGRITGIFCGSLRDSFHDACVASRAMFGRIVSSPYEIVLAELLPPLDVNLYQAQKALENCQAAVADGGACIVVAACSQGVGSDHFFKLAEDWDIVKNEPKDGMPRFGSHKLSRVNALSHRIDVRMHSEIPDETVKKVFYQPCSDIAALIAEKARGRNPLRLAVVHDAGHTVLQVQ